MNKVEFSGLWLGAWITHPDYGLMRIKSIRTDVGFTISIKAIDADKNWHHWDARSEDLDKLQLAYKKGK